MDFHIQIASIRIAISIIYFKGSQVDISKLICTSVSEYCIYRSIQCIPDEMTLHGRSHVILVLRKIEVLHSVNFST